MTCGPYAGASDDDALQRVLAAGTDWVGREYTRRLRDSLRAMREAPDEASARAASRTPHDDWVSDIVFMGGDLPEDVHYDIILAAVDETDGDEDLLWCIADGPVDHLVGRDLEWGARFHAARTTPNVDLMFRVMQAYYRLVIELDAGWWEDYPVDTASRKRNRR